MKTTFFAPQLIIPHGVRDVDFYINGLGAVELRRFSNDDGTIHVSELEIDGALFHLHEEGKRAVSPDNARGVTTTIGLFVDDVDEVIANAVAAGAAVTEPVQDYDYGYRQGTFRDPYGHLWMIEKKI